MVDTQRRLIGLVVGACLCLAPVTLSAQRSWEPARPGFGEQRLEPTIVTQVDGRLYVDAEGARCGGFIGDRPTFRFEVAETVEASLKLLYDFRGSLIVHGPDGTHCTGAPSTDAVLDRTWAPGQYAAYIGTVSISYGDWVSVGFFEPGHEPTDLDDTAGILRALADSDRADWDLWGVGEGGVVGYGTGGLSLSGSGTATFTIGGVWHDDYELSGTWRAEQRVEEVTSAFGSEPCPGSVSVTPAHEIEVLDTEGGPYLYAEAPDDVVIIVMGSSMVCATAGSGGVLHDFGGVAGRYQIWVGAQSGDSGDYRLRLASDPIEP